MPVSLDYMNLNKSEMFNYVRECLRDTIPINKSINLIEIIDDLLFFWNVKDCCLHVINWRALKSLNKDSIKYQSLIPTTPQIFHIEKIVPSNDGSLIALCGPKGISILELPRRWGPFGLFMEGKERITCKTTILSESFFLNNAHLDVLQIRWHPAPSPKCHLLALLSDNTIRVYKDTELKHIWRVGPVLNNCSATNKLNTSLPTLSNLGECVIDFDIFPMQISLPKSKQNPNIRYTWPIALLQENGNIFISNASLETLKPKIGQAILIKPKDRRNYGLDSCSIMFMLSSAPTLVIAETSGKIHHALLLQKQDSEDNSEDAEGNETEWTLNVMETVELELGLPDTDIKSSFTSPINLKRDYMIEHRYFVYHNTGLHAVSINFIDELQNYVEGNAPQIMFSKPSHVEYIVCTKIDNSEKINPILGLAIHQHPSGLISFLSSGEVISLKLLFDSSSLNVMEKPNKEMYEPTSIETPIEGQFAAHIKNILQRKVSQPILSLNKSSQLCPQKAYEVLTQSIQVLKENYIKNHNEALKEILKRIDLQIKIKEQQEREIKNLEKERDIISQKAHLLAEKFEECNNKQSLISKLSYNLLKIGNVSLPNNIIAENAFTTKVNNIQATTKGFFEDLESLKENINKQNYHISKYLKGNSSKSIELPLKQKKALEDILSTITKEIDGQIKDLQKIQKIIH